MEQKKREGEKCSVQLNYHPRLNLPLNYLIWVCPVKNYLSVGIP